MASAGVMLHVRYDGLSGESISRMRYVCAKMDRMTDSMTHHV